MSPLPPQPSPLDVVTKEEPKKVYVVLEKHHASQTTIVVAVYEDKEHAAKVAVAASIAEEGCTYLVTEQEMITPTNLGYRKEWGWND